MTQKQREVLAEKLMDVANFAIGALLIGQIIAKQLNLGWTLSGLVIWVTFYGVGLHFLRPDIEEE